MSKNIVHVALALLMPMLHKDIIAIIADMLEAHHIKQPRLVVPGELHMHMVYLALRIPTCVDKHTINLRYLCYGSREYFDMHARAHTYTHYETKKTLPVCPIRELIEFHRRINTPRLQFRVNMTIATMIGAPTLDQPESAYAYEFAPHTQESIYHNMMKWESVGITTEFTQVPWVRLYMLCEQPCPERGGVHRCNVLSPAAFCMWTQEQFLRFITERRTLALSSLELLVQFEPYHCITFFRKVFYKDASLHHFITKKIVRCACAYAPLELVKKLCKRVRADKQAAACAMQHDNVAVVEWFYKNNPPVNLICDQIHSAYMAHWCIDNGWVRSPVEMKGPLSTPAWSVFIKRDINVRWVGTSNPQRIQALNNNYQSELRRCRELKIDAAGMGF